MIKQKPSVWVELTGIEVIDADGWADGTWENPITIREFLERCETSTIRNFGQLKKDLTEIGCKFI